MTIKKLEGMLLYICVNKPVKAYLKPGTAPKPDEWKASIAISDEDVLDEFEDYIKEIDSKASIKKVKTAEFESIYKVAPPEGAGKNIWIVTFRKSTKLGKTDKDVPDLFKPKVFEKIGSTLVDITNSKLVGNGSIGAISIERFDRNNGTASLYLKNVMVTDLIEYVQAENDYNPGDEFSDEGDDEPADKPAEKAPEAPKKNKTAAKSNKETPAEPKDQDDPF
jgi:hypothetical protein